MNGLPLLRICAPMAFLAVGIASVAHERMNQQDLITEAYATLNQGRMSGQGPNRTFTEALSASSTHLPLV